jgi:hypothetical protein
MNEIAYFKVFVLCSGDVTPDVDHLYIKRINLVDFSYIVIEDQENLVSRFLLYNYKGLGFDVVYV